MGQLFVGLSGYSYKPWQGEGRFYPPDLKANQFLKFYCGRYRAVEMDGTWYKMPTTDAVAAWIEQSPEGFRYSFKAHRGITHMARLKPESYDSVQFLCKRLAPLAAADKLGPFLVQLPPNLKKDEARLAAFVSVLPTTFDSVEGYSGPPGMRAHWAFEFRHESWNCDEVAEILRAKNAGWVASDTDDVKATRRDTADFHYARLRRTEFDQSQLDDWSNYFQSAVANGKDCFVYCKHEDDGSPWEWADFLAKDVGRGTRGPT